MALPASFTTVTPFSRLLAITLLIILPILAFFLGSSYGHSVAMTSKFTMACPQLNAGVSTCVAQNKCSDEAQQCPDGSFVFREEPNCTFAACSSLQQAGKGTPAVLPKNGATKQTQITALLSQKTGIPQLELLITYTNEPQNTDEVNKNTTNYDGGTYSNQDNTVKGRWIAARINGNWNVTSLSTGMPKCSDVNPYSYPKDLVPACKDAKGNITAR